LIAVHAAALKLDFELMGRFVVTDGNDAAGVNRSSLHPLAYFPLLC